MVWVLRHPGRPPTWLLTQVSTTPSTVHSPIVKYGRNSHHCLPSFLMNLDIHLPLILISLPWITDPTHYPQSRRRRILSRCIQKQAQQIMRPPSTLPQTVSIHSTAPLKGLVPVLQGRTLEPVLAVQSCSLGLPPNHNPVEPLRDQEPRICICHQILRMEMTQDALSTESMNKASHLEILNSPQDTLSSTLGQELLARATSALATLGPCLMISRQMDTPNTVSALRGPDLQLNRAPD